MAVALCGKVNPRVVMIVACVMGFVCAFLACCLTGMGYWGKYMAFPIMSIVWNMFVGTFFLTLLIGGGGGQA